MLVNKKEGQVLIELPKSFAMKKYFIGLTVAALTSSVSLLEVVVSYLIDEKGMKRSTAVLSASAVMSVLCVFASLSLGGVGPTLFGTGAFDIFDLLTDKIFLSD